MDGLNAKGCWKENLVRVTVQEIVVRYSNLLEKMA